MQIKQEIISKKIVLIARGISEAQIKDVAKAVYDGGARFLEITFDQACPDTMMATGHAIYSVRSLDLEGFHVGAGTVMTMRQLETASENGAEFILSPNVDADIIRKTKDLGLVSIPGAYTPSEIAYAAKLGADIVKVFPASIGGISYIRSIRGPINHIPLMAVGGISESNIRDYLDNGCCSCGLGSNIVRRDLISSCKFDELTALVRKLVSIVEG